MGSLAAPGFSTLWQTYVALAVAFCCWLLNTLVAEAYIAVFEPSGLTLWTLAVAGWCGVFAAHKACDFLFAHYARHVIFLLFVVVSIFSLLLGYLTSHSGLEQIGTLAQTLATLATAYSFFPPHEHNFPSGSAGEVY
jgi:hypothetical protein